MPKSSGSEIKIKLKKFKMQWIKNNKIIVMIGSRGRGKSTILLDYLYHNQDIPYACCIAPTDCYNFTFTPCIPSRFIFAEYSPELVGSFLKRQRFIKQKKMEASMGIGESAYADADCRGLLIMDDCLASNKGWRKDEALKWIFFNGRHADITYILTMQYQVGITPDYRSNIDWIFLCKENKKVEREKLWKYYAGIFPNLNMFEQIFLSCTVDKKCMVIDSLSESDKINDQVFWFKATIRGNFRLCYDDWWVDNDHYIKKRMTISSSVEGNGTGPGMKTLNGKHNDIGQTDKTEQDDYYKYTGGRGKLRFNLDMSDEEEEKYEQDDYQYIHNSNT